MTTPISSIVSSVANVAQTGIDPSLRKAAEGFEAVMLRQVLASMRKAHLADEMFGSNATDNFREMADAKYADIMAGSRQFGIADMVEKQFASLLNKVDDAASGTKGATNG